MVLNTTNITRLVLPIPRDLFYQLAREAKMNEPPRASALPVATWVVRRVGDSEQGESIHPIESLGHLVVERGEEVPAEGSAETQRVLEAAINLEQVAGSDNAEFRRQEAALEHKEPARPDDRWTK